MVISPKLTRRAALGVAGAGLLAGCAQDGHGAPRAGSQAPAIQGSSGTNTAAPTASQQPANPSDAVAMTARATVPVLCYHQLRNWASGDSAYNKSVLICPPANLARQLDGIKDAGYTTILPQTPPHGRRTPAEAGHPQLRRRQGLPTVGRRTRARQAWHARRVLHQSVVIGNSGWISKRQIKERADAGNEIGSHTWDHHAVTKYSGTDWAEQFEKPRATLSAASGQPVDSFAYPYGAWNAAALPHLRAAGYTSAYQLQEKPLDAANADLTLRRILVDSRWDGAKTVKALEKCHG